MSSLPSINISTAANSALSWLQAAGSIRGQSRSPSPSPLEGATLSPTRPAPELSEDDSIIQPGVQLSDKLPDPIPGTLTRIELMGGGAYANVYQGVWTKPGEDPIPVAIKCIREAHLNDEDDRQAKRDRFERRIRRETHIWETTSHENILPYYGHQIVANEPMLVSPWCKNGSLKSYLKQNPGLPEVEKLRLVREAAQGLAYLHSREPPIIHADIKPENIVVSDRITSCLCDFGISRVMTALGTHTGLTTAGQGLGTAGFQGPELFEEDVVPTTMSDVYAFGGLILAVMSGETPFYGKPAGRIVIDISRGKMVDPRNHPGLPLADPLWPLLRRCWDMVPENRPTMEQIVQTLESEIQRRSA